MILTLLRFKNASFVSSPLDFFFSTIFLCNFVLVEDFLDAYLVGTAMFIGNVTSEHKKNAYDVDSFPISRSSSPKLPSRIALSLSFLASFFSIIVF